MLSITIRPARQADQNTIVDFIRQARINSRNLNWERFLVAEDSGQIAGIRQVRIHPQGTREVGSGFVVPAYRHKGVSTQLMNEILRREKGTLYLMCRDRWIPYYEQFGFRQAAVDQLLQTSSRSIVLEDSSPPSFPFFEKIKFASSP